MIHQIKLFFFLILNPVIFFLTGAYCMYVMLSTFDMIKPVSFSTIISLIGA